MAAFAMSSLVGLFALPTAVVRAEGPCPDGHCEAEGGDEFSQLQLRGDIGEKWSPNHGRSGPWRPKNWPWCSPDVDLGSWPPFVPDWPEDVGRPRNCSYTHEHKCDVGSQLGDTFNDSWLKVYPGGDTACLDGTPYYFTVRQGNKRKLHIHLQAGGSCWDSVSYHANIGSVSACYHNVKDQPPMGAFNTSDSSENKNPWKDYSFIIINYCSGDAHGGDTEQAWNFDGSKVQIRGVKNAMVGMQYGLDNFPELDQLTFSGSSAGSLGVQLWSERVIDMFSSRSKDILVVGDSFVGVLFPPSSTLSGEANLYQTWNWCNNGVLTSEQKQLCEGGEMLLANNWLETMERFPNVRFASLNSKADTVQIGFERAFELTMLNVRGATMSTGNFYKYLSLQVKDWFKTQTNYHSYLVQGNQHTYLPEVMDTATPDGAAGGTLGPEMTDWLAELVNPEDAEDAMRSVCSGTEKTCTTQTKVGGTEVDYCCKALAGTQTVKP